MWPPESPWIRPGPMESRGKGALLVRRITGDYYTIVGLPIARMVRELAVFAEE